MNDETAIPLSACRCLESAAKDPRFPIALDEKMGEYFLQLIPAGSALIHFCPWCGNSVPESMRKTFFTVPTPTDISDAESIIAMIKNRNEMLQILGEPDMIIPGKPDQTNSRTQYTYSKRWGSLSLYIQEKSDGELEMAIAPKPLSNQNGTEEINGSSSG